MTNVVTIDPGNHIATWRCRIGRVHLKNRDNVASLRLITKKDNDPSRVLAEALERGMSSVLVLGYDAHGDEYFAASDADGGSALWLIERAKARLIKVPDQITPIHSA